MLSRIKDYYFRLSIKMKLILAIMMVAILFISILSFAYYWFMKNEVVLRTETTLENNIDIMREQMTSLLSEIDSYAELIAGDEEVQQAVRESDTYNLIESINTKNEMGITLSHMINTSKSIEAVIVYTNNQNGYSSYPAEDEKMKKYFYNFPQNIMPIGNRRKTILDETIRNSYINYNGILLFNYHSPYIYANIMSWPKDGKVKIKALADRSSIFLGDILSIEVLGCDAHVDFARNTECLDICVNKAIQTTYPVCLKIKID